MSIESANLLVFLKEFISFIIPKIRKKYMKKNIILFLLLSLVLLLSSCATSLSVPYTQPSNVNMGNYRNIAIASSSEYSGSQSIPLFIRLDITDPKIQLYTIMTSYDYNSINRTTAKELTKMVNKVFTSSSYYSVRIKCFFLFFVSLYKIGKDPSQMLKEDGVDALVIPKITYLHTDEYIDAKRTVDSSGLEKIRYYIHRYIELSVSLTVLDTSTNRIVTVREYNTSDYDYEEFDPKLTFLYGYGLSEQDLVSRALSSLINSMISDFIPTKRYASITLKDNKPEIKSLKEAYKAAEDGNLDYALQSFEREYNTSGHIPSGYNAALILASRGDIDSALSILDVIRNETNDRDINKLYLTLTDLKERNEKAKEQMTPKTGEITTTESPYSYLFN